MSLPESLRALEGKLLVLLGRLGNSEGWEEPGTHNNNNMVSAEKHTTTTRCQQRNSRSRQLSEKREKNVRKMGEHFCTFT